MTPSIEERELAIDGLMALTQTGDVNWPALMLTLGATSREHAISRICELADPTAWRLTVRDNEALIERCRELEEENSRLKASLAEGDAR